MNTAMKYLIINNLDFFFGKKKLKPLRKKTLEHEIDILIRFIQECFLVFKSKNTKLISITLAESRDDISK